MSGDRHAAELNRFIAMLHNHFHNAVGVAVVMKFEHGKVGMFADMPRDEVVKMLRSWLRDEHLGRIRTKAISDPTRMKN